MRSKALSTRKWRIVTAALIVFSAPALAATLNVAANADIYAAGHSTLPNTIFPGDFPPSVTFQAGAGQTLAFSSVTGLVGCNFSITNGPDGTCFPGVDTTVTSYGGLSGISVKQANMFLVGVFLDATEPSGPGPIVLRYNYGNAGSLNTTDASFVPVIDQVFFIGDGLTGTGTGQQQLFSVPSSATRLYLGFADSFDSVPSYYADNVGSLNATFTIGSSVPEPPSIALVACGILLAARRWRAARLRRARRSTGRSTGISRFIRVASELWRALKFLFRSPIKT